MNRLPVRAGTAASRANAAATPMPPTTVVDEGGLTYKPSCQPWVKLRYDMNADFRLGQLVQVVGVQEGPKSPTNYPGQDTNWQHTDADSVYRVRKRSGKEKTWKIVLTQSIPHKNFKPADPSANPRLRYPTGDEYIYYLKERISITYEGARFEVSMHDVGVTLLKYASRLDRPGDRINESNPESWYYIARVYVEIQKWKYVTCARPCHVGHLEAVTPQKQAELQGKTLSPPHVVSASVLAVAERADKSNVSRFVAMND